MDGGLKWVTRACRFDLGPFKARNMAVVLISADIVRDQMYFMRIPKCTGIMYLCTERENFSESAQSRYVSAYIENGLSIVFQTSGAVSQSLVGPFCKEEQDNSDLILEQSVSLQEVFEGRLGNCLLQSALGSHRPKKKKHQALKKIDYEQ
ncbi:hypothetical protein CBL_04162 [Carabus blaptoides fortunei]